MTNHTFYYTVWVASLLSLPIASVMSFGNVSLNPSSLTVGVPFSIAYLAIFLLLFRWAKLGWQVITGAFLWGAGITFIFVVASGDGTDMLFEQLGFKNFTTSFAGAFPEELGKSLGILIILLAFNHLSRPWHGLAVGAFVGLGFTIAENIGYGAVGGLLHATSDAIGVAHLWGLRTLIGPAQHAVYSGIIGFGIAYALYKINGSFKQRVGIATAWWFLGFMLHFVWNSSWPVFWHHVISMGISGGIGYSLFVWLYFVSRTATKLEAVKVSDSDTEPHS